MIESYVQLLIGSFISFRMFEIRKVWNVWDMFSVACHFIGIVTVIGFFIFVCWFVIFKVSPLILKKKMERKQNYKESIEAARVNILSTQR